MKTVKNKVSQKTRQANALQQKPYIVLWYTKSLVPYTFNIARSVSAVSNKVNMSKQKNTVLKIGAFSALIVMKFIS